MLEINQKVHRESWVWRGVWAPVWAGLTHILHWRVVSRADPAIYFQFGGPLSSLFPPVTFM